MLNQQAFKDFLDFIYRTNEHLLNKARYSRPELTHTDSILIELETGGAQGGDNWSHQATNYYIDNDTKALTVGEKLKSYQLLQFLGENYPQERVEHLCKSYGYSYYTNAVTAYSQEYDYYGNGKQFDIIEVPLLDFFGELLEDEDFEMVRDTYADISQKEHQRLQEKNAIKELNSIQERLNNFDTYKAKELSELKHDYRNYQQTTLLLEKRIESFDQIKENEQNKLLKRKEELEKMGFLASSGRT